MFYGLELNPLEIRSLFQWLWQAEPPDDQLAPLNYEQLWLLWTAVTLKRVKPLLAGDQQRLVLLSLKQHNTRPEKASLLVFLDGRFFTHTGLSGFTDLSTGLLLKAPPVAWIMAVTYNLAELTARQIRESTDASDTADTENHSASLVQS